MGGASCRNTRIKENARRLTKNESYEAVMEAKLETAAPARERMNTSEAGPSGSEGRLALLNFQRYVIPIQIRGGGQIMPAPQYPPPSDFQIFLRPCKAAAMQRMNRKQPRVSPSNVATLIKKLNIKFVDVLFLQIWR